MQPITDKINFLLPILPVIEANRLVSSQIVKIPVFDHLNYAYPWSWELETTCLINHPALVVLQRCLTCNIFAPALFLKKWGILKSGHVGDNSNYGSIIIEPQSMYAISVQ